MADLNVMIDSIIRNFVVNRVTRITLSSEWISGVGQTAISTIAVGIGRLLGGFGAIQLSD